MSDHIRTEEVDSVTPPPRARVEDAFVESAGEKLERKRDYLSGFLSEKPAEVEASAPGSDLQAAVIEALNPARIVPSHGDVTDLATARADTKDLLVALRSHMKKAVDDGVDISAAVKSFDAKPFMRLLNAAELLPPSASRTYLEVERE